jgi:Tetratricopeptide repeat
MHLRHRRHLRAPLRTLGALGLIASVLTQARSSWAEPDSSPRSEVGKDEGRARFARGLELYKEGNYHAALAEFRAAQAIAPSFRLLFNIAQTLAQLQDYAGAVQSFERYLNDGAEKVDEERKREVQAELVRLRPRVARLRIVSNLAISELLIDDEVREIGRDSIVVVNAGRRRIRVSARDQVPETRILDVAGSSGTVVRIEFVAKVDLVRAGDQNRQVTKPFAGDSSSPKSRTPFFVGLGITAGFGVATGTLALLSASSLRTYNNHLGVPDADADRAFMLRTRTKTFSAIGDVAGVCTIVSAGVTIALFIVTSGNAEPESKTSAVLKDAANGIVRF